MDVTGSLGHLLLRMFHLKLARWGKEKWGGVPAGPKKKGVNELFFMGVFELNIKIWEETNKIHPEMVDLHPYLRSKNLIVTRGILP